jgi:hypothetical protein
MFDKRTGHIGPERLAVLMGSIKAAIASSVTHVISPFLFFCFVWWSLRANHSPWGGVAQSL